MANQFKKGYVSGMSGSSGSPTTLYTVPSSKASILIELDCCNTSNASQTVTAILSHGGSTDIHLIKNVPIPPGSTLKVINIGRHLIITYIYIYIYIYIYTQTQ